MHVYVCCWFAAVTIPFDVKEFFSFWQNVLCVKLRRSTRKNMEMCVVWKTGETMDTNKIIGLRQWLTVRCIFRFCPIRIVYNVKMTVVLVCVLAILIDISVFSFLIRWIFMKLVPVVSNRWQWVEWKQSNYIINNFKFCKCFLIFYLDFF